MRRVEGKGALVYFIYTVIDCDDFLGPELKKHGALPGAYDGRWVGPLI